MLKHQKKKLKLMLVPEHSGVKGNVYSDKNAKNVSQLTTFISAANVKTNITRIINIHMRTAFKNDWT